ncbi:MAG: CBS domain-containing protein [Thermoproteota archaeon]|nr:MAG: CBS domain-containing protein [Candidatus Korarchaeota archaeon]
MRRSRESEEMPVYEVMSSPVITISKRATAADAAKLLKKHKIGSLVVVDEEGVVGIITERDLVERVVAEDRKPSEVAVEEVMTRRPVTISSKQTLIEAMELMRKHGIKRLVVLSDSGELAGIVTQTDIMRVTPSMISRLMMMVKELEEEEAVVPERVYVSGECARCGIYSDRLTLVNGVYLCEECAAEVSSSEVRE